MNTNTNTDHGADAYDYLLKLLLPYVALSIAILDAYLLAGAPWVGEGFKAVILPVMRPIAVAGTPACIAIYFSVRGVKVKQPRTGEIIGVVAGALIALVFLAAASMLSFSK